MKHVMIAAGLLLAACATAYAEESDFTIRDQHGHELRGTIETTPRVIRPPLIVPPSPAPRRRDPLEAAMQGFIDGMSANAALAEQKRYVAEKEKDIAAQQRANDFLERLSRFTEVIPPGDGWKLENRIVAQTLLLDFSREDPRAFDRFVMEMDPRLTARLLDWANLDITMKKSRFVLAPREEGFENAPGKR